MIDDGDEPTCRCSFVRFGRHTSESRNWNPTCAVHGTGTQWYEDNMRERLREHDRRMGRMIEEDEQDDDG